MKRTISILCCMLALVLSLTACAQSEPAPAAVVTEAVALSDGGTIVLSVNPEIAVNYDNSGFVTGIAARNDDAFKVLANYAGFNGKQAHTVVSELVSVIGEAGYFVEEVEGEPRQIILEIEPGSAVPGTHFVDYVVREVRKTIEENSWQTPLNLDGVSDYGSTDFGTATPGVVTDYDATDYSAENGVKDYNQPIGNGSTDYDATDYDTTDYDTTDYDGGNSDYQAPVATNPPVFSGNSDYGNTDYGNSGYGNTDYGNFGYNDGYSDYHVPTVTNPPASSGNSGYGNSGYDADSGYGDSVYETPAPAPAPAPTPNYGSSGGYDADSGYSNYGGGGDSGYSSYGES